MDDLQKIHVALTAQRLILQHLFTRFYEHDPDAERQAAAAFLQDAESATVQTEALTSLPTDQVRAAVIAQMQMFFSDIESYISSRSDLAG
ncbi:hypothetical protein GJ698_02345 [Pseudoduganella sp. FT26W]|uniref:Uncharacterized protein n=1 Tax=Duganella aquatilis TaxID=2666082 RepID=A0A844D5Z8_9BURK|nr:hypothetical protein [Duganella aquatilis]MRW82930.1 hypothetical protein [Duganella aquatilis]